MFWLGDGFLGLWLPAKAIATVGADDLGVHNHWTSELKLQRETPRMQRVRELGTAVRLTSQSQTTTAVFKSSSAPPVTTVHHHREIHDNTQAIAQPILSTQFSSIYLTVSYSPWATPIDAITSELQRLQPWKPSLASRHLLCSSPPWAACHSSPLQTSAAAASITRLHIHLRRRSPGRPGLAQSFTLSLRSTLPPPLLSSNSLEQKSVWVFGCSNQAAVIGLIVQERMKKKRLRIYQFSYPTFFFPTWFTTNVDCHLTNLGWTAGLRLSWMNGSD